MASGDIVGIIQAIMPPASNPATPDIRAGGSSPAESVPIWDFDPTTDEMLDFYCRLQGYDGGGLTINGAAFASTATTGNMVWQAAIRRLNSAEDVDTSHSYDYNGSGQIAAPSTLGQPATFSITFTDGADMDSLADGEAFILRLRRDADSTSDTDDMSGDAELFASIEIQET